MEISRDAINAVRCGDVPGETVVSGFPVGFEAVASKSCLYLILPAKFDCPGFGTHLSLC